MTVATRGSMTLAIDTGQPLLAHRRGPLRAQARHHLVALTTDHIVGEYLIRRCAPLFQNTMVSSSLTPKTPKGASASTPRIPAEAIATAHLRATQGAS